MTEPIVDLVIPVHTDARPIARAVASVIDRTAAPVRVTVVAHNVARTAIAQRLGALLDRSEVRLVDLADGIRSPAGPMNFGLDLASAPWTSVMGSDDTLDPGAIDHWLSLADDRVVAVLAAIRRTDGSAEASPAARPCRSRRLDPVRDRLAYRSAPLGLVSRAAFGDLRFTAGLPSGEDLAYCYAIWHSDLPLAFARSGPGYRVHDDGGPRVTLGMRKVADDFGFLGAVLDADWAARLDDRRRAALVVKLVRLNLFDAVVNRPALAAWSADERGSLATIATRIIGFAPDAVRYLSRADQRALALVLDPDAPFGALAAAVDARSRHMRPDALLTRDLRDALHPSAPFRTLLAQAWLARRSAERPGAAQ